MIAHIVRNVLVTAACLAAALPGTPAIARSDDVRPNVVFVFADQWRADATGCAGDPNVKTPQLDRLAQHAARFTLAVSNCPVCSPYRASLVTGQHVLTHGVFVNDVHLKDEATTVAEVFKAAGYDTGYIGKWHLDGRGRTNYIPPESRQGFDYWKVLECTHDYNRSAYFAGNDPARRLWQGYDAAAQTKDAQQYIRDRAKAARPFALFLSWGPPHNPFPTAPKPYRDLYDPAKLRLRPNVSGEPEAAIRRDLAGYYAHCSALDEYVGQLLETVREAGIEQDTIFVFTSDHGEMLGSHGMMRKQKPWDESIRVPLLVRYPRQLGAAGRRLDAPIGTPDLMPTLLGLAGLKIPASVEGRDYSAYMRSGENPPTDCQVITCVVPFHEYGRAHGGREYRGVRTDRYTYVRGLKGSWLLYDNQSDPYQMTNLVGKPEAAALQARLEAVLQQQLKQAGDQFLPGDQYLKKWGYKIE